MALRAALGSIKILADPRPFDDVEDIIERMAKGRFDEICVVGPTSVKDKLVSRGILPIIFREELTPEGKRRYVAEEYLGVTVHTRPL